MQAHARQHITPYDVALQQYDRAAAYLDFPESIKTILRTPKRELQITIPVRMDDGTVRAFNGYRVHHNTALGPSQGGLRYSPGITMDDMRALAMWMTWKNALANLPFGGAKGGILCDPAALSTSEIERLTKLYAGEMSLLINPHEDQSGSDIGTDAQTMAWIRDTYSMVIGNRATPAIMTTPPLVEADDARLDMAGQGIVFTMDEALRRMGHYDPGAIRVAVQGFGKIGSRVAKIAYDMGYTVIAVSDRSGGCYTPDGLDIDDVLAYTTASPDQELAGYPHARIIHNAALLALETDVLAPCAAETQITRRNASAIRALMVIEGADGPTTPEADDILERKGIVVVPDILTNAGGVIDAYFDWMQEMQSITWTATDRARQLRRVMLHALEDAIRTRHDLGVTLRTAAQIVAIRRVGQTLIERGV